MKRRLEYNSPLKDRMLSQILNRGPSLEDQMQPASSLRLGIVVKPIDNNEKED